MSSSRIAKHRADYQAPAYLVPSVELWFELDPNATVVTAKSRYRRQTTSDLPTPMDTLWLDGHDLELRQLLVDGQVWPHMKVERHGLELTQLPDTFELTVVTTIDPTSNTALEGLYRAGDIYCTQCEAEGFRRITYWQDRPDVMSVYTTHIISSGQNTPFLLANGNKIHDAVDAQGRRHVTWFDPFAKPCYLFAMVAGDMDEITDYYTTQDGRTVRLAFYVDRGNATKTQFAMAALKRAMQWDEQRYGLSYDLDDYMVVAVDFFNMGAMENKGLNIFNSKFVLADAQTATDSNYYLIESIIGHEYFHNWTGNRVTCRDWFQLSLKEGLTVFRDQQFSADMSSATLARIDAIKTIRTAQFAEDAGPMAHPIRPDVVLEMNNFYTVTVYDKGAEVIRMLHTLLGEQAFVAGIQFYLQHFDGQAVTCDDFIWALQQHTSKDLTQFKRWYSTAGTPTVTVHMAQHDNVLSLTLSQQIPPQRQGEHHVAAQSLVIPVRYEWVLPQPRVSMDIEHQGLIVLEQLEQTFQLPLPDPEAILVLFTDFSAPVKVQYSYSADQLLHIVRAAQDGVARWDAMQQLWWLRLQQDLGVCPLQSHLANDMQRLFRELLQSQPNDLAFLAELLQPPALNVWLEQAPSPLAFDAMAQRWQLYREEFACALRNEWQDCYGRWSTDSYRYYADQIGRRALRAVCLSWLAFADREQQDPHSTLNNLFKQHYVQADNMTDRIAVLQALMTAAHPLRHELCQHFYQNYVIDGLTFDKWASLVAQEPTMAVYERIAQVMQDPHFSLHNPNRVRALWSSFSQLNLTQFHAVSGKGYQSLTEQILQIDAINPQLASRLITPLMAWRRFDPIRQQHLQLQLMRLQQAGQLSDDLYEKVELSLA